MTLVMVFLAGLVAPPSFPRPGLAPGARSLVVSVLPLLAAAFLMALGALLVSVFRWSRAGRILAMSALALATVAGFIGGRYGIEGMGGLGLLIVNAPLAAVIVQREISHHEAVRTRGRP
jgi:hypothetical protein